jgi:histone-lysine N-methyltransferase SETD3
MHEKSIHTMLLLPLLLLLQVFISYGPKSSGELLLSYGFCPPAGSNAHDAAHLGFCLAAKDPWLQAKQQALEARGLSSSQSFAVRIDGMPSNLVPYLAFCEAQPQSAAEVEQLAAELFDAGRLPAVGGVSCEQLALELLAKTCKAALKGYPQQAEADRQLATDVQAGGGFEQRRSLMANVRVRERQILSRTEFVAQQRIRQLRKGA